MGVKELECLLENNIEHIFKEGEYEKFLACASKHWRYSFINSLLIYIQDKDAGEVLGYTGWANRGRQVQLAEGASGGIGILVKELVVTYRDTVSGKLLKVRDMGRGELESAIDKGLVKREKSRAGETLVVTVFDKRDTVEVNPRMQEEEPRLIGGRKGLVDAIKGLGATVDISLSMQDMVKRAVQHTYQGIKGKAEEKGFNWGNEDDTVIIGIAYAVVTDVLGIDTDDGDPELGDIRKWFISTGGYTDKFKAVAGVISSIYRIILGGILGEVGDYEGASRIEDEAVRDVLADQLLMVMEANAIRMHMD